MARVNIEDSIYKDLRFIRLAMALGGDVDRAIGALVRAWSLAQEWYLKTPDRMIPLAEWKAKEIYPAIIDVGLAELVDDRVRIKGADEQFKWLLACSKNGKKAHPETIEETVQPQPPTGDDRRPLTPSLPLPLPLPQTQKKGRKKELASPDAQSAPNHTRDFIAAYCEQWKTKYGVNPTISKADSGRAKRIVETLGPTRAAEYLAGYFSWSDNSAKFTSHSMTNFEGSLNKLKAWLETGILPNPDRRKTKAEENSEYNRAMMEAIERGEV